MNAPLIIVSGSKGGVGKSITTMALLDYLLVRHKHVKLIESDLTNPDVCKAYAQQAEGVTLELDDVDGWIQLVNHCDAAPFKAIVVNTPARSNAAVARHGGILHDSLKELARPFITLWVINRQRDSVELLDEYLADMPASIVHVIRNGYFGEERKFELYEKSSVKEEVARRGGVSLFLPDLADRVTDDLYSKRLSLAKACDQLRLGDRTELQRWRIAVALMFESIGV